MPKCHSCGFRSNKVEVQTTEIGKVRWLNSKLKKDGTIQGLGNKWIYEGGETLEEHDYLILCKKCGGVLKEVN